MFIDGVNDIEGQSLLKIKLSTINMTSVFNLQNVIVMNNFGVFYTHKPSVFKKLTARLARATSGDVVIVMYVNSTEKESLTLAGSSTEISKSLNMSIPKDSIVLFSIIKADGSTSDLSLQLEYTV